MPSASLNDNTRYLVLAAAAACEDKRAEDTRILELDPADSGFTDFFLVTSGTNNRQTIAIADEIEIRLKREFGAYPNSIEGRRLGEWVLMDYVDFVVHIFVTEKRAFYDIERLRKSARAIDVAELKAALTEKTAAARKKAPAKKAASSTRAIAKKASTKPSPTTSGSAPEKQEPVSPRTKPATSGDSLGKSNLKDRGQKQPSRKVAKHSRDGSHARLIKKGRS